MKRRNKEKLSGNLYRNIVAREHRRDDVDQINTIYGYARVSTGGQSLDGQVEQLRHAGAGSIVGEKVSGATTDRPQLSRLLRSLQSGDVVLVTRVDRLARSTRDLLNILAAIGERGASFRSLGDAWADTGTSHGRLLMAVLGSLAEFERELIRERTVDGRRIARAHGQRFGRPPKLTPPECAEIQEILRGRQASQKELARRYQVSRTTIWRLWTRDGAPEVESL